MCRAATRFPSKEPRNGHHGKLSSLLASQRVSMCIMCLIFTGISHWLLWLHYSALFSLPLPRRFPFSDMLSGTDIVGWAILSRLPWIQFRSFPSMPSNGNALWHREEASNRVREYLPIGNGYLGGESFRSIFTLFSYWNGSVR